MSDMASMPSVSLVQKMLDSEFHPIWDDVEEVFVAYVRLRRAIVNSGSQRQVDEALTAAYYQESSHKT